MPEETVDRPEDRLRHALKHVQYLRCRAAACFSFSEGVFLSLRDRMTRLRFVHWKEEDYHLGYFEDYPDYVTQGATEAELMENLRGLYQDIVSGEVPYIRKVDELVLAQ